MTILMAMTVAVALAAVQHNKQHLQEHSSIGKEHTHSSFAASMQLCNL